MTFKMSVEAAIPDEIRYEEDLREMERKIRRYRKIGRKAAVTRHRESMKVVGEDVRMARKAAFRRALVVNEMLDAEFRRIVRV